MLKNFSAAVLFALLSFAAQAQCTGTFSLTVNSNASGLALGSSDRVRIAPGANQTSAINSMANGSELCIDAGAAFNAQIYGSNGLIRNFGAATVVNGIGLNAGGAVVNAGTMTFSSYFSTNGAISISNENTSRLVISPYIALPSGSTLSNKGSLTFGAQFAINSGATFTNDGRMEVTANWQPSGTVNNNGFINGLGQINIEASAMVNNTCWLYTQSNFYNSGTLINSGAIRAFGAGAWQNNGSFQGTTSSYVVGVNFQNCGSGVSGYGTWRFSGTTNNYAAFAGSSSANPIIF